MEGNVAIDLDGLAQQAADLFLKAFGDHPGFRLAHAKGIICTGTFEPSGAAAGLSRAAHFQRAVPVVVRFSNSTGIPDMQDGNPMSNPKGFAIQFKLPNGGGTDIVANGQNGFVAGTPEDFVGFLGGLVTTRPDSPKPTPLETFLASHPNTAAFLGTPNPQVASFAAKTYFANNTFIFVNAQGKRQAVRYQFIPVAGEKFMDAAAAAAKTPDFLFDELRERISKGPVEFRFQVELAEAGDQTHDATLVWPASRRKAELGIIRLTSVDPNSAETQRMMIYDPTRLTDGIELSDDPLPPFRSKVYSISYARRNPGK